MKFWSRRKSAVEVDDQTVALDEAIESNEPNHREQADAAAAEAVAKSRGIASALDSIEGDLHHAAKGISERAGELQDRLADQLSGLAAVRSDGASLRDQSDQAKINVADLANSISDLTQSGENIGAQIKQSSNLAEEARSVADEVGSGVEQLNQAISDIADVVDLISDITKQTNLLALNATIEAARAGDAGKGFAVVAGEVKALSVDTQKATDKIVENLDRLKQSSETSAGSVGRIIDVIGEIKPSFAAVEDAVQAQMTATEEIGQRASQTSQFVAEVVGRVDAIDTATQTAEDKSNAARSAGAEMADVAQALGDRFTMMIRQSAIGDRRTEDRLPAKINGNLTLGGNTNPVDTYDLSSSGALLSLAGFESATAPSTANLSLQKIGEIDLEIINVTEFGLHCAFRSMTDETRAAIELRLKTIQEDHADFISVAQGGAARIIEKINECLANDELTPKDLFDIDYQPIEGSNPLQVETRALAALESILPPIQEDIFGASENMAFCAAVDRNGYLPVHNAKYSHPQKPDDPEWNAGNCRNKRIFDDRAGLSAARNTRPFLIQTYARDMGAGNIVWMREIDCPIVVEGRHWGGFRTAYKL